MDKRSIDRLQEKLYKCKLEKVNFAYSSKKTQIKGCR